MTTVVANPQSQSRLAAQLGEARARTLLLIAPVDDEDLRRQHDPLMSPILWDLGHIAHFEELWLVQNIDGTVASGEMSGEMPGMYNPFENPRSVRAGLPLPALDGTLETLAQARIRALAALSARAGDPESPLLRDDYVYRMVLQHEYQHGETILQTLQLKQGAPYAAPRMIRLPAAPATPPRGMVTVPAGEYPVGTDDRSAAYDNERPSHVVRLGAFSIDRAPLTNAEYQRFMADGGYGERSHWTDEGWRWLQEAGVEAPKYWFRRDGVWWTRVMDHHCEVPGDHPVCHVCHHEAEAFARWAGKRLPTEAEWEVAASWDPAAGRARTFPWGEQPAVPALANIDQLSFDTAPVGAHTRNVSPLGCHGMIGDVWEWTASDFMPYAGYEMFPYPEYSQVFFGTDYKVLRGGSWATRGGAVRNTFRNWDYPIRRQIFSGFRCARDA